MALYSQNIESILDKYDESFDIYKSYNDRLLMILRELFNKTDIPISAITGTLMSRGALRNRLLAKGSAYERLEDVDDLISLQVVTYFHDDINLSIFEMSREFVLEEFPLTQIEEAAQDQFGILMKRLSLMLPEEKANQLEFARFSNVRAQLKVRTTLQNAWFEVKDIFDDIAKRNQCPGHEINQLAQVSYLLKIADAELCRIRASLTNPKPAKNQEIARPSADEKTPPPLPSSPVKTAKAVGTSQTTVVTIKAPAEKNASVESPVKSVREPEDDDHDPPDAPIESEKKRPSSPSSKESAPDPAVDEKATAHTTLPAWAEEIRKEVEEGIEAKTAEEIAAKQARYDTFLEEIESFVLNDAMVRELDRNIADYYNTRLSYKQTFTASLAQIFIDIDLDGIAQIQGALAQNKKVIVNLIKHIFGDALETTMDDVNRGSSLLVLFYVTIAQTGDVEYIKKHIRNHTALKGMSIEEFANDLLFYYNRSI